MIRPSLVLIMFGLCVGVAVAPLAADELKAGIAQVDITPPVPYRMSGYFQERVSTGVHDRLHAKAIVFEQGQESVAMVFCDLVGIPRAVSAEIRRQAAAATNIPAANISVAATHTHTGPLYYGALRDHFHELSLQSTGNDLYEAVDYPAELVAKAVDSIQAAQQSLGSVELRSGFAEETRLAFNRRFHMKDGTVRFNPGQLNPDIVRPAGPIDSQVGVIMLARPGAGRPMAAVVSFALHLDTLGGTEYSADFPSYCEEHLQRELGGAFQLIFGTGTCGDVNHIDVTARSRRRAPEIGRMLAETVAAKLSDLEGSDRNHSTLAVRSATVNVPLQVYSAQEIADAGRNMELIGTRQLPFLEQVKACKIASLQSYRGTTLPLEVQVIRLDGETAIVMLPGEIFVELGLAIKKASPFRTTLVIELANDSPAYIPTKRAFAEGSYETVNSHVQAGGGEMLVDAAIALLREMK